MFSKNAQPPSPRQKCTCVVHDRMEKFSPADDTGVVFLCKCCYRRMLCRQHFYCSMLYMSCPTARTRNAQAAIFRSRPYSYRSKATCALASLGSIHLDNGAINDRYEGRYTCRSSERRQHITCHVVQQRHFARRRRYFWRRHFTILQ